MEQKAELGIPNVVFENVEYIHNLDGRKPYRVLSGQLLSQMKRDNLIRFWVLLVAILGDIAVQYWF